MRMREKGSSYQYDKALLDVVYMLPLLARPDYLAQLDNALPQAH
jgi:hypothetical protein